MAVTTLGTTRTGRAAPDGENWTFVARNVTTGLSVASANATDIGAASPDTSSPRRPAR
ncbi:hypothetical protein [Halosegnis marinus]|uniref:hypothetical protein n=1 Tax=Halosegnis marinus TaxID=3034023 RepID=UPI003615C1E9